MAGKRGTKIRVTRYGRFRGVDFSTDPTLVDDARSPWAPNMVSDLNGAPEKRPGWRTVNNIRPTIYGYQTDKSEVAALFVGSFTDQFGDVSRHVLAVVDSHCEASWGSWARQIYRVRRYSPYEDNGSLELLYTDLSRNRYTRPQAVYLNGKLWIFAGDRLLCYDGTTCGGVEGYVPTTVISRDPAGGGQAYEAANLLRDTQRVGFLADGTSTVYKLPYENITWVWKIEIDGETFSGDFHVDEEAGTVTFAEAPAAPAAGAGDNVFITFDSGANRHNEQSDKIEHSHIAAVWGAEGAEDRIVASGGGARNVDYISAINDPTYWPDNNYSVVGGDDAPILGYRRLGEQLAVIKGDGGNGSSVYLRSGSVDGTGKATFTVKPCIAGVGAVTARGFGNIADEQLILTRRGVYALVSNSLTAEKLAQDRSALIDPRLRREDLANACCVSWDGCFLVFVGGHVYGLDGRQPRTYGGGYECFYWDNVPATCAVSDEEDGSLWFGTADGRVCRFNTDKRSMDRFSDDGAPIAALWSTRMDDDGDPMVLKTLLKKGCAATLKPQTRSGAQVLLRTDRDAAPWEAGRGTMDIFDWEDLDLSRFTFNANDGPEEVVFRQKVKKYKRLQIVVKNDALNEGFGVLGVVKRYVCGNFSKH